MMTSAMRKKAKTGKRKTPATSLSIRETNSAYRCNLDIGYQRACSCGPTNINCLTPKEWLKNQIGVWQFTYEARDVRDKSVHPATFPISLSKRVIELFTHEGELVLDPFAGSGTTLVAARDTNRNAVGFDLQKMYIDLCETRVAQANLFAGSRQIAIQDDARQKGKYRWEH